MTKEFDEYIADKPELNLVSKEEVVLLKIKLGKSHRKESEWDVIKEIFWKRNVLTFTPTKRVRGVTNIACPYDSMNQEYLEALSQHFDI